MTKEEKARTPCMIYAFGSCKAAKCEFLHDDANKYTGPPPRSLAVPKADPKQDKVTWIWDTGAGRHLIGKQALNRKAAACVRRADSAVGLVTGGGAREGNQTLSFEGSRLLPKDEQLYVLKECPPALSIDKTVIDGGHLFVCPEVLGSTPRGLWSMFLSSKNSSNLGLPAQPPLFAQLPLHFRHHLKVSILPARFR